ncbi:MAG: flagellar brake protein [Hydrogenophilus sp.]|nr:flagellar brake protein [Hydrogenophilus sp.]
MIRTAVRPHEFLVGKPIPFDVYDRDGRLLLRAGYVIETKEEKEKLLKLGPERNVSTDERFRAALSSAERISQTGTEEARRAVSMAFVDLRLTPGDVLQVQLANDEERLLTRYIGMLRNRSLLIEAITRADLPVFVREGTVLQIKGTSGSFAFAFAASVVANVNKPFAYHHLTYPAEVKAVRLRRTERVAVRLVCAVLEKGEEQPHGGVMLDLSLGGCLLATRHPLQVGQEVTLKFKLRLGDAEIILAVAATVRSKRTLENAREGDGYGMQFLDLSSEETIALLTYIRSVQTGAVE